VKGQANREVFVTSSSRRERTDTTGEYLKARLNSQAQGGYEACDRAQDKPTARGDGTALQ